jgi:putative nucleotidyltransferase with HDIG domain
LYPVFFEEEMNLKEGFEFIDSIEELSAMPAIALDVMAMLNDPTSSVHNIVEKVQLDQAMISYILKSCNSALYGIRSEVTSVTMAINLLGYTNLKSILMAYFLRNLYNLSGKNEVKNFLWKHSISVAVLSKKLGEKLKANPDEAYLAGLLHDIGKMVLYLDNPEMYEKVLEQVEKNKKDFIVAENELFQFSHADAGYFLMEKWKFSDTLKDVALNHHEFELFLGSDQMIGIVCFANQLAGVFLENRQGDIDKFLERYNIPEPELEKIVQESRQMIETYTSIL